jgi:hypothetical protein
MKYQIKLNYAEVNLKVTVKTDSPQKLRLKVYDATNPNRVFTNRYKTVTGEENLFVRMPLSPETAVVEVVADKALVKKGEKDNFEFISVEKMPLEKRIDIGDISNSKIRSFVEFAQRFCFNLDELEPDTIYTSSDRNYYINLLSKITNKSGSEVNTPARISKRTGVIQVSKKQFETFTVPMRLAILLHEFAHFYLNEQMDDEVEADLNGLLLYLGLGYPRIEAYQAFLETFKGVPSQQNKDRYDVINNFIKDFEKMNMVIQ